MKTVLALLLSLITVFIFAFPVSAANPVKAEEDWLYDWDERTSSSGKMWTLPGEKENDRIFKWISADFENTFIYSDGVNEFTVTPESMITLYGVIHTVTLKGLRDGRYTFSYTYDGKTDGGTFTVGTKDSSFTAMFCTDPQLGRSGDDTPEAVQDDTYGWERTLISAYGKGAELVLSAGDQVNDGFSFYQYNALFSPDTLKGLPFAPTAGNHDFYSPLFSHFFNDAGVNGVGNDYYFTFGNALFIVLDSNNILSLVHKQTINEAVNTYPDAKWRVVMLHHGAYSSCPDNFDQKICAGPLKSTFDSYGIDLVLSGHNHFYSRTYPLYNGGISSVGTVYFEGGSASGGKMSNYDTSGIDYIVHSVDPGEASYSLLTFTEDTIEVNSYLTDSDILFDSFTVLDTNKAENYPGISLISKILAFFEKLLSCIPVLY